MIRLRDSYNYPNIPTDNFLITPAEIHGVVLSNLQPRDIQATAQVSWQWNKVSILTSKNDFFLIQNFACLLFKDLPFSIQEDKLLHPRAKDEIFNSSNLVSIKSTIDIFKRNFLSVFQELNLEEIEKIEEQTKCEIKPNFFEYIFDLAKIYRKMKEIDYGADVEGYYRDQEMWKELFFDNTIFDLSNITSFEKTLEIIFSIPEIKIRTDALVELYYCLRNWDDEKAIKAIKLISDEEKRSQLFFCLNGNADDIETALKAAL